MNTAPAVLILLCHVCQFVLVMSSYINWLLVWNVKIYNLVTGHCHVYLYGLVTDMSYLPVWFANLYGLFICMVCLWLVYLYGLFMVCLSVWFVYPYVFFYLYGLFICMVFLSVWFVYLYGLFIRMFFFICMVCLSVWFFICMVCLSVWVFYLYGLFISTVCLSIWFVYLYDLFMSRIPVWFGWAAALLISPALCFQTVRRRPWWSGRMWSLHPAASAHTPNSRPIAAGSTMTAPYPPKHYALNKRVKIVNVSCSAVQCALKIVRKTMEAVSCNSDKTGERERMNERLS